MAAQWVQISDRCVVRTDNIIAVELLDEECKKGRVTLSDGSTHVVAGSPHFESIKSMYFKTRTTDAAVDRS